LGIKALEKGSQALGTAISAETKASLDAADRLGLPMAPPSPGTAGEGSPITDWLLRLTGLSAPSRLLRRHYGQKLNDGIVEEQIRTIEEVSGRQAVRGTTKSVGGAFKLASASEQGKVDAAFEGWEASLGGPKARVPVGNLRATLEEVGASLSGTRKGVVEARDKIATILEESKDGTLRVDRLNSHQSSLGKTLYDAGVRGGGPLVQDAVRKDMGVAAERLGETLAGDPAVAYTAARQAAKDKRLFDTIFGIFGNPRVNKIDPVTRREMLDVGALEKAIDRAEKSVLTLAGPDEGAKIMERIRNVGRLARQGSSLMQHGNESPLTSLAGPLEGIVGLGGAGSVLRNIGAPGGAGGLGAMGTVAYVAPAGASVVLTRSILAPRGSMKLFLTGRWAPPVLGKGVGGTVKAAVPRIGTNMLLDGTIPLKRDDRD
jgi:hypothetical protein